MQTKHGKNQLFFKKNQPRIAAQLTKHTLYHERHILTTNYVKGYSTSLTSTMLNLHDS